MCIHHLKLHTPCGHTTQSLKQILPCYPVTKALDFYHDQPREFARNRSGRALTANPMAHPKLCGASLVSPLRNTIFVGNSRSIMPEGWHPSMTFRVRQLLENGEDARSIAIIVETEWPQLTDKVSEDWIHHLLRCFHSHGLRWQADEDLQNDHLAGDIITEKAAMGCGHLTGDAKCFTNWVNPFGGGPAFCPFKRSQDTGLPMPPRPDHIPAELLPGPQDGSQHIVNEKTWEGRFYRELFFQAMKRAQEQGDYQETHHAQALASASESLTLSPSELEDLTDKMQALCAAMDNQRWQHGEMDILASTQRRPNMPGQDLQILPTTKLCFGESVHEVDNNNEEASLNEHAKDDGILGISTGLLPRTTSELYLKIPMERKGGKASSVGVRETCRDQECGMCHGNEDQLRVA